MVGVLKHQMKNIWRGLQTHCVALSGLELASSLNVLSTRFVSMVVYHIWPKTYFECDRSSQYFRKIFSSSLECESNEQLMLRAELSAMWLLLYSRQDMINVWTQVVALVTRESKWVEGVETMVVGVLEVREMAEYLLCVRYSANCFI